jgi:hypothetical protein
MTYWVVKDAAGDRLRGFSIRSAGGFVVLMGPPRLSVRFGDRDTAALAATLARQVCGEGFTVHRMVTR